MSLTYTDGSSNQATKTNPTGLGLSTLTEFSACGWVNFTTLVNTRTMLVLRGTSGASITLRLSGATGNVQISQTGSTNISFITNDTPLAATGVWMFVAVAIKIGVEGHIYIGSQSVLAAERTYGTAQLGVGPPTAETGTLEVCLGNDPSADTFAPSGKLGAFWQVYNKLVTLAEFREIQFCGKQLATNCKGNWRPGDDGGASVTDLSGTGNNLTITGATVSANPTGVFIAKTALAVPASPSYMTDGYNADFRYYVPSPSALAQKGWTTPFRVMFFYHGSTENGNDNTAQMLGSSSMPQKLGYSGTPNSYWPVLSVFPQQLATHTGTDPNWSSPSTIYSSRARFMVEDEILNYLQTIYAIDTTRIYTSGLSLGGRRMWDMVYQHPTRYAAMLPCATNIDSTFSNVVPGVPNTPTDADAAGIVAGVLAAMPIKMYYSNTDASIPPSEYQPTLDAFNALGPPATFSSVNAGGTHENVWSTAYTDLINPAGSALQTWLFAQQRVSAGGSGFGVMRRRRRRIG